MFKNSVFKTSVNTREWLMKAAVRAVKTFAQTFGGFLTVGAAVEEINWKYALSVAAVSMIYSIMTSVAGLPEVKEEREE